MAELERRFSCTHSHHMFTKSDWAEKHHKVNTLFNFLWQWEAQIHSLSLWAVPDCSTHPYSFTADTLANSTWTSPLNIHSKILFQEGLSVYKSDACPSISQNDHKPATLMTFRNDCVDTDTRAKVCTHTYTELCLPQPLPSGKWSLLIICWLPVRSP